MAQNVAHRIFVKTNIHMYIHNFLGKKVATSENFNENNHPMGENPPNLVTLRTCVWCGKSLKREIKSVLYFILTESRLIGAELKIFLSLTVWSRVARW
jgi:hypothetical protein